MRKALFFFTVFAIYALWFRLKLMRQPALTIYRSFSVIGVM